jgi:Trk K+ transport system NAD-binding subunit
MRLLEHGGIAWPDGVKHLQLVALLQDGLDLDLPDGSRLTAGVLRPESAWAGKQIQAREASDAVAHSRIAAVLRGNSVVLARPDTLLQPGDRLIVVVQPQGVEALAKELAPVGAAQDAVQH